MRWQCDVSYVLQRDKPRVQKKQYKCIAIVKATAETAAMVDAQLWHEFNLISGYGLPNQAISVQKWTTSIGIKGFLIFTLAELLLEQYKGQ